MGQSEYAAYPASGRRPARPQRRAPGLLYAPRHENDPAGAGILDKGAQVFLTTCNPTTVRDDVVAWLVERGADACAWRNMSDADWQQSWEKRLPGSPLTCARWAPISPPCSTSAASLVTSWRVWKPLARASIGWAIFSQAIRSLTGTICRSKRGLHNRHMVGLTAWHTFFQTTHLTPA